MTKHSEYMEAFFGVELYKKFEDVLGDLENIELDIRTTVHKSLLSFSDLEEMHAELAVLGSPVWTLQQFNPVEVIEEALPGIATYEDSDLIGMARKLGPEVRVRGLTGRFLL